MRLHTNGLGTRILGTLTGIGFLLIGLYAIFGADDGSIAAAMRTRATWFGITALVAGVWAIAVSWLDRDLSGVWCRPPRQLHDLGPPPRRGLRWPRPDPRARPSGLECPICSHSIFRSVAFPDCVAAQFVHAGARNPQPRHASRRYRAEGAYRSAGAGPV